MKTKLIPIIFALSGLWIFAQPVADLSETRPKNDVSISLLGDVSLFSFGYERLLITSPNFMLTGKLGLGYNQEGLFSIVFCFSPPCNLGPSKRFEKYITLPHHLTVNFGEEKKFFEFGIGGTIYRRGYLPYFMAGFKLHPLLSNKLSLRIFAQRRLFIRDNADIIYIPFGMSFGVAF